MRCSTPGQTAVVRPPIFMPSCGLLLSVGSWGRATNEWSVAKRWDLTAGVDSQSASACWFPISGPCAGVALTELPCCELQEAPAARP